MDQLNLRDAFLKLATETKPKYEPHEIEGIGTVYIKRLTAGEKDSFERAAREYAGRAVTLAHCCFDEQGARVFRDADIDVLNQLDPSITDDVVKERH